MREHGACVPLYHHNGVQGNAEQSKATKEVILQKYVKKKPTSKAEFAVFSPPKWVVGPTTYPHAPTKGPILKNLGVKDG